MKRLKKSILSMLCVTMLVMLMPTVVFAANGELRFSDPTASAGGTVEITAKFSADSGIMDAKATLSYDTNYLEFISGDGATGGNGQVELTGTSDGSSTELNWTLQFKALAEGTGTVEVLTATGTASNGTSIQVTKGSSTVTIGPGDGTQAAGISDTTGLATGVTVNVNGKTYTVNNEFSDALIPEGFEKTQMDFEGQPCNAALQASSGKYVIYLTGDNGESSFFLYDPDDGSFTPFEQINISAERYIILLDDDVSSKLPDTYQKTSLEIEGNEFPAWQNEGDVDYYVVYALNSDGKKGFYQYDVVDGTYQRTSPEAPEKEEKESNSIVGKILDKLGDYLDIVAIIVAVIIFIMFIMLIVKSVQLRHRDEELDDLYDQYGIDEDEEDEDDFEVPAKKKKEPRVKEKKKKAGRNEDDYEEYDYEEAVRKKSSFKKSMGEDEFEEPNEFEEDDYDIYEDENFADFDKELEKLPKRRSHAEEDDTFKMDIIDLD